MFALEPESSAPIRHERHSTVSENVRNLLLRVNMPKLALLKIGHTTRNRLSFSAKIARFSEQPAQSVHKEGWMRAFTANHDTLSIA